LDITEQQLSPADAWKAAAGLCAIATLSVASIAGGMPALSIGLAIWIAVFIHKTPASVVYAGPLYLFAVNVFLPSAARFDPASSSNFEMYYWAVGILLITLVPLFRLGWKGYMRVPRSLQFFLLVALASSFYGAARGNDLSYVLRQLFGLLLFFAYFAFGQHFGDEEEFCCKTRNYSIPCVFAFVLYYISTLDEYGIHKEITTLGTMGAALAILFIAKTGWKWRLAATILMLPGLLLVQRRDLVVFVLALVLICLLRTKSIILKFFMVSAATLIMVFSLAPPLGAKLLDAMLGTSVIDRWLPEGARDISSLEDRNLQLVEAGLVVAKSPMLGQGMGGELGWMSASRGDMQQAYIDNGWAYLLTKMGMLGVMVFLCFVWVLLRNTPGNSAGLSACILSMLLLVMFAEPVFFQFTTSPLLGAIAGMLYGKKQFTNRY
jgi:hypothetical protein